MGAKCRERSRMGWLHSIQVAGTTDHGEDTVSGSDDSVDGVGRGVQGSRRSCRPNHEEIFLVVTVCWCRKGKRCGGRASGFMFRTPCW